MRIKCIKDLSDDIYAWFGFIQKKIRGLRFSVYSFYCIKIIQYSLLPVIPFIIDLINYTV